MGLLQQAVHERNASAHAEIEKLQEAVREMDAISQKELAQAREQQVRNHALRRSA